MPSMTIADAHGLSALYFRLLKRHEVLRQELLGYLRAARRVCRDAAEEVDRYPGDDALIELRCSLNLTGIERDARELDGVAHTLMRMRKGEYGLCLDCGKTIGYARLSANPLAVLCVACGPRAAPGGTGPVLIERAQEDLVDRLEDAAVATFAAHRRQAVEMGGAAPF